MFLGSLFFSAWIREELLFDSLNESRLDSQGDLDEWGSLKLPSFDISEAFELTRFLGEMLFFFVFGLFVHVGT